MSRCTALGALLALCMVRVADAQRHEAKRAMRAQPNAVAEIRQVFNWSSSSLKPVTSQENLRGAGEISASCSPNPSTYGDEVTLKIHVALADVQRSGSVVVEDGDRRLGAIALDEESNAALKISLLTAGKHRLTVTYFGN